MNDDRTARAPGRSTAGRTEPVIEVELTDRVALPGSGPDPGQPSPPRASTAGRARLLAAAAAVVAVVAVVAMTLGGDDDPADTSAASSTSGAVLTTPSTLPPIEATDPGGATEATTSQDRSLFEPTAADLPAYPAVAGLTAEELEGFDLTAAVARLDDDVPRRSRTEYVVGASGYSVLAIITYEPAAERFAAILTYDVGTTRLVVDVPGDALYLADDEVGGWERTSLDEVRAGPDGLDGLLRRLVLGPVRADTLDQAVAVEAGAAVTLDVGRTTSREFTVALPARVVPEWSRYALGATGDAPPPGDDDAISYSVFVDERGEVRRVQGASTYGATGQTIVHSIELLPDASVALPDPATVRDAG